MLRDGQAGVLGGGVVAGCRMHVQTDLHAVTDVLAQYSTAVRLLCIVWSWTNLFPGLGGSKYKKLVLSHPQPFTGRSNF